MRTIESLNVLTLENYQVSAENCLLLSLREQQLERPRCYIDVIWLSDTALAKTTQLLFKSKFNADVPDLPLVNTTWSPRAACRRVRRHDAFAHSSV